MGAPTIIRLILSAVLVYFIYTETGLATTIFCTVITIMDEIQTKAKTSIKETKPEQSSKGQVSKLQQRIHEEMKKDNYLK